MRVIREAFEHWEAAEAFVMGIELANCDHLAAHEPREEDGRHIVYVHDWDDAYEEVCPVCGWGEEGNDALADLVFVNVPDASSSS